MIAVTVKADRKQLDHYLKLLDKNRGRPLEFRAERTITAAATRILVPAIRAAAPVGPARRIAGGPVKPGNLRRRVRAKRLRKQAGETIRPTWVGSSAYYMHMVVGGTKRHPLAPREAGRTVSFTNRFGKTRSFTANLQKGSFAVFAIDEVRPLAGMEAGPHAPDPFLRRAIDPNLDIVYSLVARDVFAVK